MLVGEIKQQSLETNWGPCYPLERNEQKQQSKIKSQSPGPEGVIGGDKGGDWEGKDPRNK